MIDDNLKPWLIEVNILPSLSCSSPLDKKIKTSMLANAFHICGLVPYDRTNYAEERKKLDYLKDDGRGLPIADKYILQETEDEYHRRGLYKRIYPSEENPYKYLKYFARRRHNNELLAKWEDMKKKTDYYQMLASIQ